MKRIFCLGLFGLFCSNHSLFAQNINIPADSIQTLLCKKWEVDYALMGGMKIERMPGAAEINYEFNKDKTFLMTSNDPNDKAKGTWIYDPKKKSITLTLNGRSNACITSIKDGQLVMIVDTKEATPDDPMEIQMVYKIKSK